MGDDARDLQRRFRSRHTQEGLKGTLTVECVRMQIPSKHSLPAAFPLLKSVFLLPQQGMVDDLHISIGL